MHDDFIGAFEGCPTAKDMWDKLKTRFGETSTTRLRSLHLKWMQYRIDTTHTVAKLLQTMNTMVQDLKEVGYEISDEEQVLNVIKPFPGEPKHWKNVKLPLIHSKHLKAFAEIQSHLKMEEECLKHLVLSMMLLLLGK